MEVTKMLKVFFTNRPSITMTQNEFDKLDKSNVKTVIPYNFGDTEEEFEYLLIK